MTRSRAPAARRRPAERPAPKPTHPSRKQAREGSYELAGARMNWLGLPEIASMHGADVDRILVLVHLLMIVMFVGWGALFVYMLVRFRRSRHPVATYGGLS